MNRRELLKAGATLVAGPALVPAQERPQAAVKPATTDWKPSVFTLEQNAAVVALTELIIPATDTPGAREAKVNQYIDVFLHDAPPAERERFLTGLNWLDEYARSKNEKPFERLTPEQQTAILADISTDSAPDRTIGYQFFRMAKSMTVSVYYVTPAGYRDLNKGGVPGTFACEHPAANKPSA